MLGPRVNISRSWLRAMSNVANTSSKSAVAEKKPSRMMQIYMEKRKAHEEFIAKERSDFELGKKHLANMMGMDANSMTQDDVDKAIEYLFPSGLQEPGARPIMKPPEEVFPKQKSVEFDYNGRPFHPFFFTNKPQYTQIMYELAEHIGNIIAFSDRMRSLKVSPNPEEVLDDVALSSTKWMSNKELSKKLIEDLSDKEYDDLINGFERLLELPFSYKSKDFIFKCRVPLSDLISSSKEIVKPEYDAEGQSFVEYTGQRKSSVATVKVLKPGSGRFSIRHIDYFDNECDITYFYDYLDRHQIMYPLQFTRLLGLVDVECVVDAGGPSSQAGAIRYALSMCLRSFVDQNTLEEMKVCGLLTQDVRVKERKKPGQAGARKKFFWRKR